MTSLLLDRQQVSEAMSLGKRLEKANWGYILIAGPICSGKTTLSRMLENFFGERYISVTTIREEDYLRPLEDIPHDANGYLIDCLDAYFIDEFKSDIKKYFKNRKAELPIYDLIAHERINSKQYVFMEDVTIIEGPHVISLFKKLEGAICIYMDTPLDVCLNRRVEKERRYYQIPEEKTVRFFNERVIPSYKKDILPQRNMYGVILYESN